MSQQLQSVLEAALNLSSPERASLVDELLRSLDDPSLSTEEQADVEIAWSDEIQQRIADVESGRVQLLDGDEFRQRLRSGLRP